MELVIQDTFDFVADVTFAGDLLVFAAGTAICAMTAT
jgi:hypothetical protein